jgi:hypothetical protein
MYQEHFANGQKRSSLLSAEDEIQEVGRSDLLPLDFKHSKAGRGAKRSRVQALLRWKKRRENQLLREVLKKEDLKMVPFSFLVLLLVMFVVIFAFLAVSSKVGRYSEPFAASAVGKQRLVEKLQKDSEFRFSQFSLKKAQSVSIVLNKIRQQGGTTICKAVEHASRGRWLR